MTLAVALLVRGLVACYTFLRASRLSASPRGVCFEEGGAGSISVTTLYRGDARLSSVGGEVEGAEGQAKGDGA